MTTRPTVRSVSARGVTIVPFDRVNVTVKAQATRPNSTEAKDAIGPVVRNIQDALTSLEEAGVTFVEDRTSASMNIGADLRYDPRTGSQNHNGYAAVYNLTVQTEDVDRASEILDVLTNVQDAQVSAPDFKVDNVEQHFAAAFEDGYKRALSRFQGECAVLNKNPDNFIVSSWDVRYDESQSAGDQPMRMAYAESAFLAAGPEEPVQVVSGKATIAANVVLTFAPSF